MGEHWIENIFQVILEYRRLRDSDKMLHWLKELEIPFSTFQLNKNYQKEDTIKQMRQNITLSDPTSKLLVACYNSVILNNTESRCEANDKTSVLAEEAVQNCSEL
jgi:hypothetical protein